MKTVVSTSARMMAGSAFGGIAVLATKQLAKWQRQSVQIARLELAVGEALAVNRDISRGRELLVALDDEIANHPLPQKLVAARQLFLDTSLGKLAAHFNSLDERPTLV